MGDDPGSETILITAHYSRDSPMLRPRTRTPQIPPPFDSREIGRRFKRALDDAGWEKQDDAVAAIREAVPGTRFNKSHISSLIHGYRMPHADRLIALMILLKLDPRIMFPELFPGEGHPPGSTDPDQLQDGCQRPRPRESSPTTEPGRRSPFSTS